MCNETIDKTFTNMISELTDKQLGQLIGDALTAFQQNKIDAWVDNPSVTGSLFDARTLIGYLSRTSLVTKTFMSDEESTSRLRNIGVVAVLEWLISVLEKDYKVVLKCKYFARMSNKDIAKELSYPLKYVGGNLRLNALVAAARQLKEEMRNPKGEEKRKHLAIQMRYTDFEWESIDEKKQKDLVDALTQIKEFLESWPHNEKLVLIEKIDDIKKNHLRFTLKPEGKHLQQLLRLCAITSLQSIPTDVLITLANRLGIENPRIYFSQLKKWIVQEDTENLTKMRDSVAGDILYTYITREEHKQYALLLLGRRDFVGATKHFIGHNFFDPAADILISHYNQIIESGKIRDVYELFVQGMFTAEISSDRQSLFHIAMGCTAKIVYGDRYDKARTHFDRARIVALDNYTRALVCYYLGKLLENSSDFDRSLNEFEQGAELLTNLNTVDAKVLLIYLYVAQYWIYLLQKQDELSAEEIQKRLLTQAKNLNVDKITFSTDHPELPELQLRFDNRNNSVEPYIEIENALGGSCDNDRNIEEEIKHYTNALNAANHTGKPFLITRALHNLGQAKIHSEQENLIKEGIKDVNKAKIHAENCKLKEYEGKCLQTLGAACFYKKDYQEAIDKYLQAAKIFKERNTNDHWLASVYADLCEAYFNQFDFVSAREYFKEAYKLSDTFGFSNVKNLLEKHLKKHPILDVNFDVAPKVVARILRVWGKIAEKGHTSRDEYMKATELLGIEVKTATVNRDINKLQELGLLANKGNAKATIYYPVSLPPTQQD